ncbi:hypothetical protein [Brucella sp. IR073]|uniref:hypothetical protein n=1 Tax=unclassified Brucella TaxID=2632610 RepID=UPI003B980234
MATSFAISPTETQATSRIDSLQSLGGEVVEKFKRSEQAIRKDIQGATDPSGPLMKKPPYVEELFQHLAALNLPPEQQALYSSMKKNMAALEQQRKQFIARSISRNYAKIQIELSIKAISKSISSIQQILSSQ